MLLFCGLQIVSTSAFAQGKGKKYSSRKLQIDDTQDRLTISEYGLTFPNINKVFYYRDERALSDIRHMAAKGKDITKILPSLERYVSQFGIRNFYVDTDYLWRLGQLYEQTGQPDKAKAMYRLVLKHHRRDVSKVKQYYDSVTVMEQDYYVPLDYYYELVDYRKSIDTLVPPRGVFTNMGGAINTMNTPDYAPTITLNKNTIIFTSKRSRSVVGNRPDENLFVSQKFNDIWGFAEPLDQINSPFNEGSATLSQDGKTIIFTRCESPDGYGNCDLFEAILGPDSTWIDVKNMGVNINGKAWESHPSLSPDGKTLYFASDRLGGFGLSDIYYSRKVEGKWTRALNMGPIINTRGNELSPFVHPVHKVLYFSSNGQLVNFGNYDIYKSYRHKRSWTEPKNIGPLVNGSGNEYYFTIDADSEFLYYARSEKDTSRYARTSSTPYDMGDLDLYSFPLPMEAQPTATTVFKGSLKDSLGNSFKGIVSVIDLDDNVEVAPKSIRPDGSFEFDLIKDRNYLLIIQGDDFFRIENIFELTGDTTITLTTEPISKLISFSSVKFEEGKARILTAMEPDLDNVLNFMVDHPKFNLKIAGHTDTQGDRKKNLNLSQRRADAIKDYLMRKGQIDKDRIEAIGFGSNKPLIVNEKTEEDRRKNRRVEFELIRE